MRMHRVFIVLVLLSSTVFGADKVLKSLPLRTSLIVKANLDAIKKIGFVNKFLKDSSNIQVSEFRSAIKGYAGLDIMEVKELWVVAGTEDEYMFIARGGFDTLPVETALRKLNKYGEIKIDGIHFAGLFDDDKNPGKKNLYAVLNDDTVILGQPEFSKKYLEVFTGKKTGISPQAMKIVESVEGSKNLIHAKTVNVYIPEKEKNNPVLNNIAAGELTVGQNSKYLTARLDADAKDKSAIAGLKFFLSGALNKAKQEKDPNRNPIVAEGLKFAKVDTTKDGLSLQTKFSLTVLELMVEDQLNGLEAIFE